MTRTTTALLISLFLAVFVGAPGGYDDVPTALSAPQTVTDRFLLPDDLEATLWAASPLFFNPTNIDVDAQGRVWVAEAVNYRDFNNGPDAHWHHPAGDRIVVLEDTDQDGAADTARVFVQDAALRAPLGLAVIGGSVIVSSSPSLLFYTDVDGDLRADRKDTLLTGFGGYDHDHGLHALVAGPDGRWYVNTGNAGPHHVTDRAGWTLRSGSLYTGGSPYNTENAGAQVSDDGHVWVGGLALRLRPDGTGLAVLGHNFRNAYELTVDSFGNLWQNDNDDEVLACRVTWLMEGGNAGYFSADGTRTWQADRRPGQDTFTAHWHQEDPGVLPAGDRTGAGAPTGIVVYEGDALGPAYRGLLLSADAGRNVIFGYRTVPDGAGFRLERFDFMTSVEESTERYVWNDDVRDDLRKWFRPSDVAVGPDGAIYVADWYDPVVGGHQMRDPAGTGRIYRITPKGRRLSTPALDLATTAGQLQALQSPALHVRPLGFERLKEQGDEAVAAVHGLLASGNPYHRARAVWLLAQLGPAGQAVVEDLLDGPDDTLRATAFRALRQVTDDVLPYARRLARDPAPAVRREVALALRDVPPAARRDLIVPLAEGYDGSDPWYLEALGAACDGLEAACYTLLRDRLGGDPAAWDARFAGLAWRLHPPNAVADLQRRAGSARVPEAERRRALTALGFVAAPEAAQAMADLTRSDLPDIAAQAGWWMQYRTGNAWHAYAVTGWAPPVAAPQAGRDLAPLLAALNDPEASIDRRVDAAAALAADPVGGLHLIGLAAQQQLSYQVRQGAGPTLFRNPERTVRVLARGYFSPPGEAPARDAEAIAGLPADAARGRMLFASACAACHRVGTLGGDVGPALTAVRNKLDERGLLDALLHPGAAVAHGYAPVLVTTRDGDASAGILLADGEAVVLRDAYGRQHQVAADRVAARHPLQASLMPGPDELHLTDQDLADLTAFLLTLPP